MPTNTYSPSQLLTMAVRGSGSETDTPGAFDGIGFSTGIQRTFTLTLALAAGASPGQMFPVTISDGTHSYTASLSPDEPDSYNFGAISSALAAANAAWEPAGQLNTITYSSTGLVGSGDGPWTYSATITFYGWKAGGVFQGLVRTFGLTLGALPSDWSGSITQNGTSNVYAAVEFDVGSIPAGASITAVDLVLPGSVATSYYDLTGAAFPGLAYIEADPLNSAWNASTATYSAVSAIAGSMAGSVGPVTPGQTSASISLPAVSTNGWLVHAVANIGQTYFLGSGTPSLQVTYTATATTITVSFSESPATQGDTVSITATVGPDDANGNPPSGTVTFYDGSTELGTASLAGGQAVVSCQLAVGSHAITAAYAGNFLCSAGSGTSTLQVVAPLVVPYYACHAATNLPATGDAANHTLRWIADGVAVTPQNATEEVDAANCPGVYTLAVRWAEAQCKIGRVAGKSATSGVVLIGEDLPNPAGLIAGLVNANLVEVLSSAVPSGSPAGLVPADVQSFVGDTAAAQAAEICYGVLIRRAQVIGSGDYGYGYGGCTAPTTSTFCTTLPAADANHYQGQVLAFNTGSQQQEYRQVATSSTDATTGYTLITLVTALTNAPVADDWFCVLGRLRQ